MPEKHKGRVAILCGASSGIGYAVAETMAAQGYTLILNSRSPEAAAKKIHSSFGVSVTAVPGDLADPAVTSSLAKTAGDLGRIDALLLNYGGPPVKSFLDTADEEWERYFKIMLLGPLRLLRGCVPLFRASGGGRVVAITSFTVKDPSPAAVLSNSLRAALTNALKTAALEVGSDGILINLVAPGYIATERLREWNATHAQISGDMIEHIEESTTRTIPLRRYGTPAEVAAVIAFLLSPSNGYVNGQQILVDGGLVASL